jgi:FkbM family methyltransferase
MGLASKVMSQVPVRVLVPSIAWQYRLYEPELRRLDEFVPRDRDAVDVGAWWGPWSWWLARQVPRVDSFEPNPDLVVHLASVMPTNVTVHPIALSDRRRQSNLWIPTGGVGTEGRASLEPGNRSESKWRKQEVTTSRLDDVALGDVGFVKIDVEGHELAVLQGATDLLGTQRPTLMIEVEQIADRHGRLDAIIEFLGDRSYSGQFLKKGRWHRINELDRQEAREMAKRIAQHSYGTGLLLYARRYVHNFIFKPR